MADRDVGSCSGKHRGRGVFVDPYWPIYQLYRGVVETNSCCVSVTCCLLFVGGRGLSDMPSNRSMITGKSSFLAFASAYHTIGNRDLLVVVGLWDMIGWWMVGWWNGEVVVVGRTR